MVEGSEIQKRRCICDFFFQNYGHGLLNNDSGKIDMKNNEKELRYVREALLNVLNKYKITFSNYSIENMVIHIMVAIRRYQFYQYVSFENNEIENIQETKAYQAAMELKIMLENQFPIILPDDEVVYLAIHIQSKAIVTNDKIHMVSNDVDELLYNIYRRINKRFNLSFFLNGELNELLKLHIPAMVNRVRNQLYMRNPLLYKTMRQYQFAVEVCLEAVDEIEKWYDIILDENEFAYLVLYFNLAIQKQKVETKKRIVLVCGNGRPEMILMLNQLNERFSNQLSDIVTLDLFHLNTFAFQENDILISTIPLSIDVDIPFIYLQGRFSNQLSDIVTLDLFHLNTFAFQENDILISTIPLSIDVDIPFIYLQGNNDLSFQELYDVIANSRYVKINMGDYLTETRFHQNVDIKTKEDVIVSLENYLASEIGKEKAQRLEQGMFPAFSEIGKNCVILHSLHDVHEPIIEFISLKMRYFGTKLMSNISSFVTVTSLDWV